MESQNASHNRWIKGSLFALWFNGFWALMGAWYILSGAEGMDFESLHASPFSDYFWPGIILLFAVGGSSLLAAAARHLSLPWRYELTFAAGCILLGWIIAEFIWLPEFWAPQLLFALCAGVMIIGGYLGMERNRQVSNPPRL